MEALNMQNFENGLFTGNTDSFPIVYIRFKGEKVEDKDFDEYLSFLTEIYSVNSKFVVLNDLSQGGYMKSEHRIKLGKWTKENMENIQKQCRGVAFLTDSLVQKTLLQGIFLVQSPPYEYIVVKEEEKAHEWLKEQLEK